MKQSTNKKHPILVKVILAIVSLFIISTLIFLTFRDRLLERVINNKTYKIEQKYNLDINYSSAKFTGISTVNISELSIVPVNSDTLLTINAISVVVKPIDIILNRIRFADLTISNSVVNLKRDGSISNYLFLLDKHTDTIITDAHVEKDYGSRVSVLLNGMFNHIPSGLYIDKFKVQALIDDHSFSFFLPGLRVQNSHFNTLVQVTDDTTSANWRVSGLLDSYNKNVSLNIRKTDSQKVKIPFIKQRWNTLIEFDSAGIELSYKSDLNNVIHLNGKALLSGPLINHPRISPEDIEIKQSEISYHVNVGKSYLEVDSTTVVSFNDIAFNPYLMYIMKPNKIIAFKVNAPNLVAQDFFNSLPAGLFRNLEGIKVKGNLSFNLDLQYAVNQPDSLLFNARLLGKGFSVERFGNTNFTYINSPFVYTAYENGKAARQIMVGEENPNYRSISEIPEHLKQAIMTSEDGQFYYHNGFVPDAIRYSLITNIKEKRFARGGSTISMQLVKNVFLNRSKNITRKVEEMLITWLIESRNMVSKDRMLEVYLNIIETGPMIYGVNEAAQFYFKKDVSKLNLAECVYIASIVPRPKLFKYSFDKEGNLREYLTNYYTLVSSKMLNRGWITQEEFDKLEPEVTLRGPAKAYIVTDSVPSEDELIKEKRGLFDFLNINLFKKRKT